MIIYKKAIKLDWEGHPIEGQTIIELLDNNTVKKKMPEDMHDHIFKDDWIESYKNLSDSNKTYVKVLDLSPEDNSFTMEYIPNCVSVIELLLGTPGPDRPVDFNLKDTHVGKLTYQERFELIPEIWNAFSTVWSDTFKYNTHRYRGKVFANTDLSIRQFVFDIDMNIRLIDVDPYRYINHHQFKESVDPAIHWNFFIKNIDYLLGQSPAY
tara:strand:+ start:356 stop:985 length:630 start_codon:yes stop_codon:yes gene_type:complete